MLDHLTYIYEKMTPEEKIQAEILVKGIRKIIDNAPHMHIMVVDSKILHDEHRWIYKCTCGLEIEKSLNE